MLLYRILADIIVAVHFSYVAFVVFGMILIVLGAALKWRWIRNPWFRIGHLLAITIVAGQAIAGVVCPLTTLENALRARAGQETYPGAFVGYWAHRLVFYQAPAWVFTLVYVGFGLAVLGALVFVPPRWPLGAPRSEPADGDCHTAP